MKKSWRWKTILGLVAIFVAGFLAGGVTSLAVVYRIVTRPEQVKHWADKRLHDLEKRLALTPEQKAKIDPIVERAGVQIRGVGANAFADVVKLSNQARADISKELTPEQRTEFDKLDKPILAKLTEWAQKEITVKSREVVAPENPKR